MTILSRRAVLGSGLALGACSVIGSDYTKAGTYECPPCGCSMDDVVFAAPGRCPDCDMVLRPASDPDLGTAPAELVEGAGHFTLTGSTGKLFTVHYFKPASFTAASPILLIIPGAGRNSAEYRNAWLEAAEGSGALIFSLGYPEETYDFAAYNMGGLVSDLAFSDPVIKQTSGQARTISLGDNDISFKLNPDRQTWLFNDFDLAFDHIVEATESHQGCYDIFGHSAGGQILHRMALFQQSTKANRIIAANAGFYTLPTFDQPLPTGLGGTIIEQADLSRAFDKKLIVMIGQNDNGDAVGGTLLKTPLVNRQGQGRFQRGQFFYSAAVEAAERLDVPLNWELVRVPRVGHEFEAMSSAAAELLDIN
ncbi:hypothetical protein [Sphingorhabdus sp. Alg231-15]|uniref:hypothetical protein n=1 Tax=Sphingorhabdus sp. Alg231-15 TaxID=1922222 RepID=UPI00307B7965